MALLPFGPELGQTVQIISPKNVEIIGDGKIHRGTNVTAALLEEVV